MLDIEVKRATAFISKANLVDSNTWRLLVVVDNRTNRPWRLVEVLAKAQAIRLVKVTADLSRVAQNWVFHFRVHVTDREVCTPTFPEELVTK